ncbi:MAG: type II toxin-antitoxin system RelE family toxin [Cellulosilyticaceae bacterium]
MTRSYQIVVTKQVAKFIAKQDKVTQGRITKAVRTLPDGDVKKLKGYESFYRLRVGEFRVIFEKQEELYKILLIDIGNRGQIYNKY